MNSYTDHHRVMTDSLEQALFSLNMAASSAYHLYGPENPSQLSILRIMDRLERTAPRLMALSGKGPETTDISRYLASLDNDLLRQAYSYIEQEAHNPDTLSEEFQLAATLYDVFYHFAQSYYDARDDYRPIPEKRPDA